MPSVTADAARVDGLRLSAPSEYARILRKAHEATISGHPDPRIPTSLLESWQRSIALGINPERHSPLRRHEVDEARTLGAGHPLAPVIPALTQLLADETPHGRHLLIVTDHQGEVLWRVGSSHALQQADSLEFIEGADWSESGIGTNAISEALITGAPAQLLSAEHLVRSHHEWACTASPIRDPRTSRILGILDVSGPINTVTPDSLRMVRCAVRLAEELLRSSMPAVSAGDGPPATLKLNLLGDTPTAEVDGGARQPLTLRRAEILALLASRSGGWSAEELAYHVHGEDGAAASVRTEMHRIRAALGKVVEANPYRFAAGMEVVTDVSTVTGHLRAGRVGMALEVYRAPLLARSGNLAIELLRDELNAAVGASVRASGNRDLMLRWCSTDMGADDFHAWAAGGAAVGNDPRLGLLQARMARKDREFGA
ncbi:helix-turn-helix domain-containing protein [Paenarthrobacter sp. JL.01a]|uniref:helix-turn-helix domain-containing protein n=1 Tax=Paenarthrobacter sp. JL.01a TaxID=2979324 RepID=UPI0021C7E6DE|nr:helix-turn-helix domain-containing protein [Paenarthrobacter sp. JL.01a]UXM90802.1 transcriptional regulator [Paenarthrobacter sp. JL.01a]